MRNNLIDITVFHVIFNPVYERAYSCENWEGFSGRTSRNSPAHCASKNKFPILWTHKRPTAVTVTTTDRAVPAKTSAKHWLIVNGLKKWVSFGTSWEGNRRHLGLLQRIGSCIISAFRNSPALTTKKKWPVHGRLHRITFYIWHLPVLINLSATVTKFSKFIFFVCFQSVTIIRTRVFRTFISENLRPPLTFLVLCLGRELNDAIFSELPHGLKL